MEDWKVIEDYPNYEVSREGEVRNIKRGAILSKQIYDGYYKVKLCKDGKTKMFYIHKLIANTFIPNPDEKPTIDHINRNRLDNRVENLRYATRLEQSNNRNKDFNGEYHHIHKQSNNTYQVRVSRSFTTLEEAIAFRDSLITST